MTTEAPAARALLDQANQKWPKRDKKSDGILPSKAHTSQNPTSAHELGNAGDVTHDPGSGADMHVQSELLRRRCVAGTEKRAIEIIFNVRICTAARGWVWRRYDGDNPHRTHMHVTLDADHRDDTGPWWGQANQEDDMVLSDDDVKKVAAAVYKMCHADAVAILRGPDQPASLDKLKRTIDAIAAKVGVT